MVKCNNNKQTTKPNELIFQEEDRTFFHKIYNISFTCAFVDARPLPRTFCHPRPICRSLASHRPNVVFNFTHSLGTASLLGERGKSFLISCSPGNRLLSYISSVDHMSRLIHSLSCHRGFTLQTSVKLCFIWILYSGPVNVFP